MRSRGPACSRWTRRRWPAPRRSAIQRAAATRPARRRRLDESVDLDHLQNHLRCGGGRGHARGGWRVVRGGRGSEPDPECRSQPQPSGRRGSSSAPSDPARSAEPTSSAPPAIAGAWIATGTMGTPRSGHTAVRLLDGRVLVVGGSVIDVPPTSAELYDPDSGTWSATGNMISRAMASRPRCCATAGCSSGMSAAGRAERARCELYDPASGTWTDTGKKDSGGRESTATLLRDGRVLVIGYNEPAECTTPPAARGPSPGR